MKIKAISGLIGLLFLLLSPQNILAQSCGTDGSVCTGIGSQSSCCTGYTCSTGAPTGNTGICRQSPNTNCPGGPGEPCCTHSGSATGCSGSLICSPGNICVDPTSIATNPPGATSNIHGNCGETKIDTAIGCIPVLGNDGGAEFTEFVLRWAIGVGGGIAFILILYAGFMLMTSTGNPERIKAGQELLTSAISGLILLIFSVFILNFIGINILGIFK